MDPNTRALAMGSAGGETAVYVEDVFSTWLYTGNNSTQTITNGIDLSGKGGMVWIKNRTFGQDHFLHDSARGFNKGLRTNLTDAEFTDATQVVASSTGFTVGSSANVSPYPYASWTFRKQAKFFDVVTYTGNGASPRQIAHNLGSVPGCIIVKGTSAATNWPVYHRSMDASPQDFYMILDGTTAKTNAVANWGNTSPTSTQFTIGGNNNVNGITYVAYLFAHNAGGFGTAGTDSVISCGSFSGTGFVNLGWEPQWILIKPYDQTYNWEMYDNMRGMGQPEAYSAGQVLRPNTSDVEGNGSAISFEATGFTQSTFGSSYPCIYIAIRRGPMKTPTSATSVFSALARTGTGTNPTVVTTGTSPDLLMSFARTASPAPYGTVFFDKLRGISQILQSASTSAEATTVGTFVLQSFLNIGFQTGADFIEGYLNYNASPYAQYALTRAPGFFDVVAYTGTGSARTVSHNLGVAPELMLVKSRSANAFWRWYWAPLGATKNFYMPNDEASVTQTEIWNNTSPTSTVFTVGTSTDTNFSARTYIAYLFASITGISKIGSYTGTGTTLNIDCGFTAGARFVMIKRSDSTGDWYVWDTARGIVSGNDPYLLLNSTAVEDTSTDYIDPLSSGFQISSTAPAAINANGGTFVYLAIA